MTITGMHVVERGSGERGEQFLLLHGYGASSFSWRYWEPRLGRLGRVVTVDLKGFGSAPAPDDGAYDPETQAALVVDLIEQRDLRDLTLVGHSLGGGIALIAASTLIRSAPHRLRRLVLAASAAYPQRLPPFVWFSHHPGLAEIMMRAVGAPLIIGQVLRSIVYDPGVITNEWIRGYATPLGRLEVRRSLLDTGRSLVPENLDQVLARFPELRVPTLLLWGRQDRVVPLWVGRRLAQDLPDARLVVLERCGHLPQEERPDESFAALERFLDDTPA